MKRSRTFLLVEDNVDDVDLALRAFEREKLPAEIVVARDGEEALDYLFATGAHLGRDQRARPALVLLDLKLPKIDGLEVLRRVRADPRTRTQPVVVLSSSVEERDLLTSYDLGVNSFVRKPVDFGQFSRAAIELTRYWLTLNEPPPLAGGV